MRTRILLVTILGLLSPLFADPPPDPFRAFAQFPAAEPPVSKAEELERDNYSKFLAEQERKALARGLPAPPHPLEPNRPVLDPPTSTYTHVQPNTAIKLTTKLSLEPEWAQTPQLRKPENSSPYADVQAHFPHHSTMRWREYDAVDTTTHEMTHALNTIIAFPINQQQVKNKTMEEAHTVFYVGQGRCYTLGAPKTRHQKLQTWLPMPPQLAQPYGIYIKKPDRVRPLDMFDEWTAYMQDVRQSTWMAANPKESAGQRLGPNLGQLPAFAYFCTALAAQIEQDDPEYAQDFRFQTFFHWCHRESARLYNEGRKYPLIAPKDDRRQGLVDSKEAAGVRHWLKTRYDLDVAELYPKP